MSSLGKRGDRQQASRVQRDGVPSAVGERPGSAREKPAERGNLVCGYMPSDVQSSLMDVPKINPVPGNDYKARISSLLSRQWQEKGVCNNGGLFTCRRDSIFGDGSTISKSVVPPQTPASPAGRVNHHQSAPMPSTLPPPENRTQQHKLSADAKTVGEHGSWEE